MTVHLACKQKQTTQYIFKCSSFNSRMCPTQQNPRMCPTQQNPRMCPTQQNPRMCPTQQNPRHITKHHCWNCISVVYVQFINYQT